MALTKKTNKTQTNKGKNSYCNEEITAMRGKKRKTRQCGCHLTLTLPFYPLPNLVCLLGSAFSINHFVVIPF